MDSKEATPSEDTENAEKEAAAILEQLEEWKKSTKWKTEMRKKNLNAGDSRPEEEDLRKLDSKLAKNTAFVRKIKTYTESQKSSILKDLESLNLTKYISEVASAITEAKIKMSEVTSLLEICSVLHQKYLEFATFLMEEWKKLLGGLFKSAQTSGTGVPNPSKLRVDIRLYGDLISIGILTPKEALPLLGSLLTGLTGSPDDLTSVGIILTFCRYCGDDFAGLMPRKVKLYLETHPEYEFTMQKFLPVEKQKNVQSLLKEYFNSIVKKWLKDFKELKHVEKTNYKILMTKGEVHAERKQKLESLSGAFKKLQSHVEQLSDILDEDLPPLVDEDENAKSGVEGMVEEVNENEMEEANPDSLGQLWEDDDTKSFYESLVDLQEIVPAILYKDSKTQELPKIEESNEELTEIEEDAAAEAEADIDINEAVEPVILEDENEDQDQVNISAKMMFTAYLAKLPNCVNREMIDQAATEFCMQFNTKNNRKKLVKALYSVHRNRQDLLPFYGRFVATLNPCMPDIAVQLGQYLKQEFRWQLRKKDQMKIESKLKVCRFIGELVKFNMFPKSEALFCLKQLLFDFAHHHIEMACTLLDTCGRFCLRSPESHQRTKIYLEQMMRKKVAMTLDQRYIMMIDNAYYSVNPPITEARSQGRKLTPIQEYIEKLIFNDLSSHNTEKVLKQIRRLHWNDDPEEAAFVVKTLGSVWNYKFNNIRYGASLIAGLASYHDWVGVQVVDDTLENLRNGLELNDTKFNQKRLAVGKFIGELYNYRLIDSSVVFKVLYTLLTYGADANESGYIPLDQPEDMLRLRIVCTILDTCGAYFVSGSSKTKLRYFLAYFQQYYWKKRTHPLWNEEEGIKFPFEVANNVEETLKSLRPKIPSHKSLEECDKEVKKIEEEMVKLIKGKAPELSHMLKNHNQTENNSRQSPQIGNLGAISEETEDCTEEDDLEEDMEEEDEDEDEDDDEDEDEDSSKRNKHLDDEDEDDDLSDNNVGSILDEDSAIVHVEAPKLVKCEEDDEFVNMFDKMMNETIRESKASIPKSQEMDIVAPVHLRQNKKSYAELDQEKETTNSNNTIQFAVLMRKGPKQTLKELAVPKDSDMAQNLLKQEEAQRLEKEKMKKLTLEINERQEEEDLNEAIAMMQRPGLVTVNRDRKPKAVPHKGVPNNVDAIFGNKRTH